MSMEVDADLLNGNRVVIGGTRNLNSGFDHVHFHQMVVTDPRDSKSTSTFTIPRRYTNLQFLNCGAQGTVVSADDLVTGQSVAIKKMQQPFVMTMSAKRAYREFILLTTIKHPNVIILNNAFTPQKELREFKEIYLVMELMSHDLHKVIKAMKLDHRNLSFFVYQMLCAVRHLHCSGIIHRDLKPSNIVVDNSCIVKILDFGLSRKMNTVEPQVRMSDYVVTRYYRAPEVILGMEYDEKVDIWSIGCIFAEMLKHRILFPGKDRIDQWTSIIEQLGTPPDSFIKRMGTSAARYVLSLPRYEPRTFDQIFPDDDFLVNSEIPHKNMTAAWARDLLSKILQIDQEKRYSVDEALNHPYVKHWFKNEEVNAPLSENRYNEAFDVEDKSLSEWKALIFHEVMEYQRTHDIFGTSYSEQTAL